MFSINEMSERDRIFHDQIKKFVEKNPQRHLTKEQVMDLVMEKHIKNNIEEDRKESAETIDYFTNQCVKAFEEINISRLGDSIAGRDEFPESYQSEGFYFFSAARDLKNPKQLRLNSRAILNNGFLNTMISSIIERDEEIAKAFLPIVARLLIARFFGSCVNADRLNENFQNYATVYSSIKKSFIDDSEKLKREQGIGEFDVTLLCILFNMASDAREFHTNATGMKTGDALLELKKDPDRVDFISMIISMIVRLNKIDPDLINDSSKLSTNMEDTIDYKLIGRFIDINLPDSISKMMDELKIKKSNIDETEK